MTAGAKPGISKAPPSVPEALIDERDVTVQ
jgi:hypothetical protein